MATPPGPGPLVTVHRVTIWTALAGALAYLAWETNVLLGGWEVAAAVRVGLALVATVAIGIYLRSLRGLAAKLTPVSRRSPEV
jgi:hypothetical protein